MSREIKFRALFHPDNEWVDLTLEEIAKLGNAFVNYKHWRRYTGLLDKDGVEIYEGDILKGTSYLYGYQLNDGEQFDYMGQVIWQSQADVGLAWMLEDADGGAWMLNQTVHRNDIDYSTGEVIGNIYANPELLDTNSQIEGGNEK